MKNIFISLIKFYRLFISPLFPATCRYYPTCSEYAMINFQNSSIFRAIFSTFFRILRCNPLFKGGIDYPVIYKKFSKITFFYRPNISKIYFWYVPLKKDKYYIIKSLDFKKDK
ncbi:membrane protein insertion efficiency factor, YidD family [Campylobacter blaseri]|uniref:Putative membrane protein insertion efficiency factor n=1 Tax=Campylobacter blaseri TaxID=2042961 RepID=A0A2P8QZR3_9BACT|nr:membrane protein insertion efficiency factor YidD [Campylobacter blaseri]PSM51730.1 membrane protein insertion efficiency factor YidD [Campylobacter blaseri]PSM53521.1 membrane protein insertion efficiency factor YidD [Campylobacter blaseri]QKF86329.1 membrane protein insertion efficiency factor, YidD family [Campylobacter blaseri]